MDILYQSLHNLNQNKKLIILSYHLEEHDDHKRVLQIHFNLGKESNKYGQGFYLIFYHQGI